MRIIDRESAINEGLVRFFTGEPCKKRGHVAERYTLTGACVQCMKERHDARAQRIRDRLAAARSKA